MSNKERNCESSSMNLPFYKGFSAASENFVKDEFQRRFWRLEPADGQFVSRESEQPHCIVRLVNIDQSGCFVGCILSLRAEIWVFQRGRSAPHLGISHLYLLWSDENSPRLLFLSPQGVRNAVDVANRISSRSPPIILIIAYIIISCQ